MKAGTARFHKYIITNISPKTRLLPPKKLLFLIPYVILHLEHENMNPSFTFLYDPIVIIHWHLWQAKMDNGFRFYRFK